VSERGVRDDAAINARLIEAAATGEPLELILVVRGRLRPGRTSGRWRVRTEGQRVLTFAAEAVIAATPLARPASPRADGDLPEA
jgi:hypothetical protein